MKVRDLNINKYKISSKRFRELYYFCLQYDEWKKELKNLENPLKSIDLSNEIKGSGTASPTEDIAIKRLELSEKCNLIEETAKKVAGDLYEYLLLAITKEKTFNYISLIKNIPCSRNTFYSIRRKFYFLLSQSKK